METMPTSILFNTYDRPGLVRGWDVAVGLASHDFWQTGGLEANRRTLTDGHGVAPTTADQAPNTEKPFLEIILFRFAPPIGAAALAVPL